MGGEIELGRDELLGEDVGGVPFWWRVELVESLNLGVGDPAHLDGIEGPLLRVGFPVAATIGANQVGGVGFELAPGDPDVAVVGADRNADPLVHGVRIAERYRCAPGRAAVGRAAEHDGGPLIGSDAEDLRPRQVDVAALDVLVDGAPVLVDLELDGLGAGARDVHRHPRLVDEGIAGHVGFDDPGVDELDWVAALAVVEVHVAGHEERRPRGVAAVEDDPGEVEEAVGARSNHRIRSRLVAVDGRGGPVVLRISRKQRAPPGHPAVEGLVDTEPGVAGLLADRQSGEVHRAVVVGEAHQAHGVAGRNRNRRLVLPLQERVAVRPGRARDHVDVGSDPELPILSVGGSCQHQRENRQRNKRNPTTNLHHILLTGHPVSVYALFGRRRDEDEVTALVSLVRCALNRHIQNQPPSSKQERRQGDVESVSCTRCSLGVFADLLIIPI